jgi:hypothetical protein
MPSIEPTVAASRADDQRGAGVRHDNGLGPALIAPASVTTLVYSSLKERLS